jgi:prepilin-type processing-associated H-X9-DG protein
LNKFLAQYNTQFAVLKHAWWVPRPVAKNSAYSFPVPGYAGTQARDTNGWPRRLEDRVATTQPVISDWCDAPGFNKNLSAAQAGHPIGGKVQSVNLGFADGHVESHSRIQIQWQYVSPQRTAFY